MFGTLGCEIVVRVSDASLFITRLIACIAATLTSSWLAATLLQH